MYRTSSAKSVHLWSKRTDQEVLALKITVDPWHSQKWELQLQFDISNLTKKITAWILKKMSKTSYNKGHPLY